MIHHIPLLPFRHEPTVLLNLNDALVLGSWCIAMKVGCKVDLRTHGGTQATHVRPASCGRLRNTVAAEGGASEFGRAVDGGTSDN